MTVFFVLNGFKLRGVKRMLREGIWRSQLE